MNDFLEFENEPDRDNKELVKICKKEIAKQKLKSSLSLSENIKLNNYIDEQLEIIPKDDNKYTIIIKNMIFIKKYLIYNHIGFYHNINDKDLGFITNIIEFINIIYNEIIKETKYFYNDYKYLFNIIIKYDKEFIQKKENYNELKKLNYKSI
jgi:hypothetical protein